MADTTEKYIDAVTEAYKKDVDRTLLRENLKLTVEERILKAEAVHKNIEEMRAAGERHRQFQRQKGKV